MLTETQIGILRDIAANKIDLDTCGEWMRDQLVDLVLNDGGPDLIDTLGPSVVLTKAGRDALDLVANATRVGGGVGFECRPARKLAVAQEEERRLHFETKD